MLFLFLSNLLPFAFIAYSLEIQEWTLHSCDGRLTRIPASVPGYITTDLIAAAVIEGDPYFRFNELSWNWIPQSCWEYKSEAITVLNTDSDYPLLLKLDSIDTVAEVFFNNVFLGTCENAFHPHFFEIPTNIITSEANVVTLRFWPILNVTLYKQNVYPYEVPSTQNYNVWAEPSHRSFVRKPGYDMGWDWGPAFLPQGVSGKVHLLQHIEPKIEHVIVHPYIDLRSKTATVNIFVMSERNESLETESFMENVGGTNLKVESWFEVYVDDKFQFKVHTWALKTPSPTLGVLLGSIVIGGDNDIPFRLWWPRGYGEAALYELKIIHHCSYPLSRPISSSNSFVNANENPIDNGQYGSNGFRRHEVMKTFGLRVVELVQEPISDSHQVNGFEELDIMTNTLYDVKPTSFYFRINGVSVFAKGANFVPIDSFQSRVTDADREYLLSSAVSANMNMIRVWGGGLYQPDDFYERANRLGIMIWQEMMYACALYPSDDRFLESVKLEITFQISRLQHNPSIVVWGGNNENEVALQWFESSLTNRDLYVSDYSKLYGETIYPIIANIDGWKSNSSRGITLYRPWVDSSPSNGLISPKNNIYEADGMSDDTRHSNAHMNIWYQQISTIPYAKLWGSASTTTAGDMHYYNYDADCEDISSIPEPRFISEFGSQSHPSFLTYRPVLNDADMHPNSEVIRFRQRHENGDAQMEKQMLRHFDFPHKGKSSQAYFDNYLYLTQVQQSRCYEIAFMRWRQLQSVEHVKTMGILFWQLNDVWQGPSWSSIEWGGRWKPVQYISKRTFASVALSFFGNSVAPMHRSSDDYNKTIELWIVNDRPYEICVDEVKLLAKRYDNQNNQSVGDEVVQQFSNVWIGAQTSLLIGSVHVDDVIGEKTGDRDYIRCMDASQCYLKLMAGSSKSDATYLSTSQNDSYENYIYPTIFFLTPIKEASLSSKYDLHINRLQAVQEHFYESTYHKKMFWFEVTNEGSAACLFLFFELKDEDDDSTNPTARSDGVKSDGVRRGIYENSYSGWFTDNNFVLDAGGTVKIAFSPFLNLLTEDEFYNRLQYRCLQDIYEAL